MFTPFLLCDKPFSSCRTICVKCIKITPQWRWTQPGQRNFLHDLLVLLSPNWPWTQWYMGYIWPAWSHIKLQSISLTANYFRVRGHFVTGVSLCDRCTTLWQVYQFSRKCVLQTDDGWWWTPAPQSSRAKIYKNIFLHRPVIYLLRVPLNVIFFHLDIGLLLFMFFFLWLLYPLLYLSVWQINVCQATLQTPFPSPILLSSFKK